MPIAPRTSSPHAWRRRALGLVAVAALALGATACSDDGDDDAGPTTEATGGSTTTEAGDTPTTDADPAPAGDLPELDEVEQPYADALMADEDVTAVFGEVDQECLSVRWVDLIGGERFKDAGLTPDEWASDGPGKLELDEATATKMVDLLEGCGGDMKSVYAGMIEGFGVKPDAAMLACMEEAVPTDEMRAFFVKSFQGGDDENLFEELGARWAGCSPAEG